MGYPFREMTKIIVLRDSWACDHTEGSDVWVESWVFLVHLKPTSGQPSAQLPGVVVVKVGVLLDFGPPVL